MERYIEFITNHWMLFIALLVVTYLLIQELFDNVFKRYKSLAPIEAVTQLNTTETVIIDVSETKDYRKGHITDAINIPSAKLDKGMGPIEKYKDSPILVLCQTGARSAPACKQLYKSGFHQVINLIGGLQAWEDQKLPIDRSGKAK
jgi:rhodanese-related sulfurtransferase